ncbi:MAG: hypothetical protein IT514_08660, partial [Burkholderiales bacterium]|nr:hypothetical protein [Burkholderiales bacterium]
MTGLPAQAAAPRAAQSTAPRAAQSAVPRAALSAALRAAQAITRGIAGSSLSIFIFHRVPAAPDPLLPGEMDAGQFGSLMTLV